MRIKVSHSTTFAYAPPARNVIQHLRLTPRSFDSQYVMRWRVEADIDGSLRRAEDSLGNILHSFTYTQPVERFTISAVGEVETSDAVGVVRGAVETLPPEMFLRASPLAQANATLRAFVAAATSGIVDPIERLHAIMGALRQEIAFDPEATVGRSGAAEALALKRGGAGDFALLFIACARWLSIPARYVSGYVLPEDGEAARGMSAWAEALTPGLGWIAFDAVRDVCPSDGYVRVAVGFDAQGAAPIRGSHSSGDETLTATVRVEQAIEQRQE